MTARWTDSTPPDLVPGSVQFRLHGKLLTLENLSATTEFVARLSPGQSLAPGPHQWHVAYTTLGGQVIRTTLVFEVSGPVPTPSRITAIAGQQKVALFWEPESISRARGGFRVYRAAPGQDPILISGPNPLRQPNFVDPTPIPSAVYFISGIDHVGQEGPRSQPMPVTFPGRSEGTPGHVQTQAIWDSARQTYVLLINATNPAARLFRIEAASNPSGPFEDLLQGEWTSLPEWPVPNPWEETRRWFRLTPANVDGIVGEPGLVGPLEPPAPSPPVSGLSLSGTTNGHVLLEWDPYPVSLITGYQIERQSGGPWSVVAVVAATQTTWLDTHPPAPGWQIWRVRALWPDGRASAPSEPVGLWRYAPPATPGAIRFADSQVEAREGDLVTLEVLRVNGTEGPAFVSWSTGSPNDTAVPWSDYETRAGLLVFEPGQSRQTIHVPLLADHLREETLKTLTVTLRSLEGGPTLAPPSSSVIRILDGPQLAWASRWMTTREDLAATIAFRVRLSFPASHPVRVDYEFLPDSSTATLGVDFLGPAHGTLHFPPGSTEAGFLVTILDDNLKEGSMPETILYRLTNPGGASLDTSDPLERVVTLEIWDDDTRPGHPVFARNIITIREGQSVTLPIQRIGGADGALPVYFVPVGGNASPWEDWIIEPEFLFLDEGQTNASITLTALHDHFAEGMETFLLAAHAAGASAEVSMLCVLIQDAQSTNSLYDVWAAQQGPGFSGAHRAPHADPDADGLPNWVEYIWQTRPTTPNRLPLPHVSFPEPHTWRLTVITLDDPNAAVVAEFAHDLTWTGSWFSTGTWQSRTDGTRIGTFEFPLLTASSGFVRFHTVWAPPE